MHVIDTLNLGGAERFLVGLVKALDSERFQPIVVWVSESGPFVQDLERAGIEVIGLHARGHRDPSTLFKLVRLMRERNVQVVNTYLFVDGFYARLAALLAGVPLRVVTQQSAYEDPRLRLPAWQIWLNRALVPITQQFVAVSRAARDYLHRVEWVPERKIEVIPNAIEPPPPVAEEDVRALRRAWGLDNFKGVVLGTVARLEPPKGVDILLEAVGILHQRGMDVRCVIVGEGSCRQELEVQARALGIYDVVRFAGARRDIPLILSLLDIFVLPSRFEGLSLALLEAMAAARPVVATAVSGSVEVIRDGENGVLVPREDPAMMAEAIRQLAVTPERAQQMGEQARADVLRHFTVDVVARQYEALYARRLRAHDRTGSPIAP